MTITLMHTLLDLRTNRRKMKGFHIILIEFQWTKERQHKEALFADRLATGQIFTRSWAGWMHSFGTGPSGT